MNLKRLYLKNKDFIRNLIIYGLIGLLAAVVDFGILRILSASLGKYIANIISMHVGMLISFSLNSIINFQKTNKIMLRFFAYYLIILIGMGLSTTIFFILGFFTDSIMLTKLISIIIVSIVQFILNRKITFNF